MDDFSSILPTLPQPNKVDDLISLARAVDDCHHRAARRRLIEAMDVVLGQMRPPAMVISVPSWLNTDLEGA